MSSAFPLSPYQHLAQDVPQAIWGDTPRGRQGATPRAPREIVLVSVGGCVGILICPEGRCEAPPGRAVSAQAEKRSEPLRAQSMETAMNGHPAASASPSSSDADGQAEDVSRPGELEAGLLEQARMWAENATRLWKESSLEAERLLNEAARKKVAVVHEPRAQAHLDAERVRAEAAATGQRAGAAVLEEVRDRARQEAMRVREEAAVAAERARSLLLDEVREQARHEAMRVREEAAVAAERARARLLEEVRDELTAALVEDAKSQAEEETAAVRAEAVAEAQRVSAALLEDARSQARDETAAVLEEAVAEAQRVSATLLEKVRVDEGEAAPEQPVDEAFRVAALWKEAVADAERRADGGGSG